MTERVNKLLKDVNEAVDDLKKDKEILFNRFEERINKIQTEAKESNLSLGETQFLIEGVKFAMNRIGK